MDKFEWSGGGVNEELAREIGNLGQCGIVEWGQQPVPPAQVNPNYRRGPVQPATVIIERMVGNRASFIEHLASQRQGEA